MIRGDWLNFSGGPAEAVLAVLFGLVGISTLAYSFGQHRELKGRLGEFTVFLLVLVLSGLGIVYTRDLLVAFVLWELATLALWRLVSHYRDDSSQGAGAWALYVNFGAAALMLVGLATVFVQYGTLDLDRLQGQPLGWTPSFLILVGVLAKSAMLPLYIWLPRAYRAAPAPVCALLSGVAENIGLVFFYKLFVVTVAVPASFMQAVAYTAVVSSLFAGGMALGAGSIRSVLAYSTIGQLGFVFLGLTAASSFGLVGGLLYIVAHGIAKSGLFFSAGAVEESAGTGDLSVIAGHGQRAPVLAIGTAVLMLSVIGLPPFLGFFAKLGVLIGLVRSNLVLAGLAVIAALFTVLYMTRLFTRVFLGETTPRSGPAPGAVPTLLVVVMAVISLLAGIAYYLPVQFLGQELAWVAKGL